MTSRFGDERFFFQHERTKKDFKFWSGTIIRTLLEEHPLEEVVDHVWDVSAWPTTSEEEAYDFYTDQIT